MPLAVVSLGQATLTWRRQALAFRPDKASPTKPDIVIFELIVVVTVRFIVLLNPLPHSSAPIEITGDHGYVGRPPQYQRQAQMSKEKLTYQRLNHDFLSASPAGAPFVPLDPV